MCVCVCVYATVCTVYVCRFVCMYVSMYLLCKGVYVHRRDPTLFQNLTYTTEYKKNHFMIYRSQAM